MADTVLRVVGEKRPNLAMSTIGYIVLIPVWAIVTLTTVGYGDIAPRTPLGQAIAAVIMILGYGIIAVPTGIVTVRGRAGLRSAQGADVVASKVLRRRLLVGTEPVQR
jgi:voltage-gated potassium channel Kch